MYAIPPDNPFVNSVRARPEIWAYGLRNPWKFGVDPQTGAIFAADNGWESWEMVHRIVRGGNCGWPVMEGRVALRKEVEVGPTPILPPVKDHPHTEANSVIGGPVYRGEKLKQLDGSFIYGDYITGTIWAVHADKDNAYSHTTLVDTDQRIVAFTQGADGELFVLDYDLTGQIYQLLPSELKDTSADFPRRLSETGLFTSLEALTPAVGVVPLFGSRESLDRRSPRPPLDRDTWKQTRSTGRESSTTGHLSRRHGVGQASRVAARRQTGNATGNTNPAVRRRRLESVQLSLE